MKQNIILIAILGAMFSVAFAATVGDKAPAGKYGSIQCPSDGGTALIPLLPNQNALAVRNFINDGGTPQTIFIGFDQNITIINGFPIKDQEILSIDIVAQAQGSKPSGSDSLTDGGVTITLGVLSPTIRCTAGTSGGAQDLHYIDIK